MPNQIASLVRPLLDWFSACQRDSALAGESRPVPGVGQ